MHLGCSDAGGFGHLTSQTETGRVAMIVRMILIGNEGMGFGDHIKEQKGIRVLKPSCLEAKDSGAGAC